MKKIEEKNKVKRLKRIMKTREDEIRYLIYLKGQLIKQTKKEIQNLSYELKTIEGTKRLERKRRK